MAVEIVRTKLEKDVHAYVVASLIEQFKASKDLGSFLEGVKDKTFGGHFTSHFYYEGDKRNNLDYITDNDGYIFDIQQKQLNAAGENIWLAIQREVLNPKGKIADKKLKPTFKSAKRELKKETKRALDNQNTKVGVKLERFLNKLPLASLEGILTDNIMPDFLSLYFNALPGVTEMEREGNKNRFLQHMRDFGAMPEEQIRRIADIIAAIDPVVLAQPEIVRSKLPLLMEENGPAKFLQEIGNIAEERHNIIKKYCESVFGETYFKDKPGGRDKQLRDNETMRKACKDNVLNGEGLAELKVISDAILEPLRKKQLAEVIDKPMRPRTRKHLPEPRAAKQLPQIPQRRNAEEKRIIGNESEKLQEKVQKPVTKPLTPRHQTPERPKLQVTAKVEETKPSTLTVPEPSGERPPSFSKQQPRPRSSLIPSKRNLQTLHIKIQEQEAGTSVNVQSEQQTKEAAKPLPIPVIVQPQPVVEIKLQEQPPERPLSKRPQPKPERLTPTTLSKQAPEKPQDAPRKLPQTPSKIEPKQPELQPTWWRDEARKSVKKGSVQELIQAIEKKQEGMQQNDINKLRIEHPNKAPIRYARTSPYIPPKGGGNGSISF